jgi:hypothetical protein
MPSSGERTLCANLLDLSGQSELAGNRRQSRPFEFSFV